MDCNNSHCWGGFSCPNLACNCACHIRECYVCDKKIKSDGKAIPVHANDWSTVCTGSLTSPKKN